MYSIRLQGTGTHYLDPPFSCALKMLSMPVKKTVAHAV
jgi:hypothetical protein